VIAAIAQLRARVPGAGQAAAATIAAMSDRPIIRRMLFTIGILLTLVALVVVSMPEESPPRASEESWAGTTLKTAILAAEVQCQAGDFIDPHPDRVHPGTGEYAFFTELSGLRPVNGVTLNLLSPPFQHPEPEVDGFRYIIYLPAGDHAALRDPYPDPRNADPAAAALLQKYWIAYTWPADIHQGRRMFAIDAHGNTYATWYVGTDAAWNALNDGIKPPRGNRSLYSGDVPRWNALYGGGHAGWSGDVSADWQSHWWQ
jgi:hypothetical protein